MQVESKIVLNSRLSVEGPLRLKEEYVEAVLESPKVVEESVPEQLKGAFGQAVSTAQQLPVPVKDAISSGLKIPLSKHFNKFFSHFFLCRVQNINTLKDKSKLVLYIFLDKSCMDIVVKQNYLLKP